MPTIPAISADANPHDQEALIAIHGVTALLGPHKTTIYRLISEGVLPPPIKVGRSSLWVYSELLKTRRMWIAGANEEAVRAAVTTMVAARR